MPRGLEAFLTRLVGLLTGIDRMAQELLLLPYHIGSGIHLVGVLYLRVARIQVEKWLLPPLYGLALEAFDQRVVALV